MRVQVKRTAAGDRRGERRATVKENANKYQREHEPQSIFWAVLMTNDRYHAGKPSLRTGKSIDQGGPITRIMFEHHRASVNRAVFRVG
jgi:hypothetical protein